jgi:hypothetical protein
MKNKILQAYEADLDKIRAFLRSPGKIEDNFKRAGDVIASIEAYTARPFRPNLSSTIDLAREMTAAYLKMELKLPADLGSVLADFSKADKNWDEAVPQENLNAAVVDYGKKLIEISNKHTIWKRAHSPKRSFSEVDAIYWQYMHFAAAQVDYFFH